MPEPRTSRQQQRADREERLRATQERLEGVDERMDRLRDWIRTRLTEAGLSIRGVSERLYPRDPDRLAAFLRGDRKTPPLPDEIREMVYIMRQERGLNVTLVEAMEIAFNVTRADLDQELRALAFYDEQPGARQLDTHDRLLLQDIVAAMLARTPGEMQDGPPGDLPEPETQSPQDPQAQSPHVRAGLPAAV